MAKTIHPARRARTAAGLAALAGFSITFVTVGTGSKRPVDIGAEEIFPTGGFDLIGGATPTIPNVEGTIVGLTSRETPLPEISNTQSTTESTQQTTAQPGSGTDSSPAASSTEPTVDVPPTTQPSSGSETASPTTTTAVTATTTIPTTAAPDTTSSGS